MNPSRFGTLPLDRLLRANQVCNRFEQALRAGRTVAIESFVAEAIEADRGVVRAELEAILAEHALRGRPPEEVGEYLLEQELGRGAMGWVYQALHRTMKRRVAIKFLQMPATEHQAEADQRFQREVEILAQLHHPHLVRAFDAGRVGPWRYLVTELIDGMDLSRWVRTHGPMPVAQGVDLLEQMGRGLEYLHGRGIVHRDLKPANVMIDRAGQARILDVGLARMLHGPDTTLTRPGWIVGTVEYMAPEQAESAQQADARSDLYSLGCTLHFLLQGRPPYSAPTLVEAIVAHREQPIPRLDAAPQLQELFERLLAKKPEERVASATEMLAELGQLRPREASEDGTLVLPAPRQERPRDKKTWMGTSIVLGLATVVLVLAGSWWLRRSPGVADSPLADAASYQRQWARHLGVPVTVTDETGIAFVFVPPGRFRMGSTDAEIAALLAEQPDAEMRDRIEAERSRSVEISRPFYLGTTEVTIGQFRRFIAATGRKTYAEKFSGAWGVAAGQWVRQDGFFWDHLGEHPKTEDMPVFNITHDEAEAFCRWLNGLVQEQSRYRLPVEAEWEYACRAGSVTPYCGGDVSTLQAYAWFGDVAKLRISPVGRKQPNAFGLFDMHGNHAEWCGQAERSSPLFTPLPGNQATDRPSRGGSFFEPAERLRSAARDWAPAHFMGKGGFRVLKEVP